MLSDMQSHAHTAAISLAHRIDLAAGKKRVLAYWNKHFAGAYYQTHAVCSGTPTNLWPLVDPNWAATATVSKLSYNLLAGGTWNGNRPLIITWLTTTFCSDTNAGFFELYLRNSLDAHEFAIEKTKDAQGNNFYVIYQGYQDKYPLTSWLATDQTAALHGLYMVRKGNQVAEKILDPKNAAAMSQLDANSDDDAVKNVIKAVFGDETFDRTTLDVPLVTDDDANFVNSWSNYGGGKGRPLNQQEFTAFLNVFALSFQPGGNGDAQFTLWTGHKQAQRIMGVAVAKRTIADIAHTAQGFGDNCATNAAAATTLAKNALGGGDWASAVQITSTNKVLASELE